jgi:hypothetical protein
MRSAPPIVLELRASRRFELALALIVLAALAACAGSGLPWLAQLGVAIVVLALGLHAAAAHRAQAGLRLVVDHEGSTILRSRDGTEAALRLSAWACRGPLVTLRLSGAKARRDLFLLPDSADEDALRRLRVRLAQLGPPEREPVG